jgi:hypothetical protein
MFIDSSLVGSGLDPLTVTLQHPHPPRLARALNQLIEELNNDPPHLPADNRPITYQLKT